MGEKKRGWTESLETAVEEGERALRSARGGVEARAMAKEAALRAAIDVAEEFAVHARESLRRHGREASVERDGRRLVLRMPELSEINRANLEVTAGLDEESIVVVARRSSAADPEDLGRWSGEVRVPEKGARTTAPPEGLVEMLETAFPHFVESWYRRAVSDELNRERTLKVEIGTIAGGRRSRGASSTTRDPP